MLGPLTDDNLRDHLTAFADGELDAAQALTMWAYLADHPGSGDALRWLRDQQRLTMEAERTLKTEPSAEARAFLSRLTDPNAVDLPREAAVEPADDGASLAWIGPDRVAEPRRRRRRPFRVALAAAAGLAILAAVIVYHSPGEARAGVVPAATVVDVGRIHAACSRLPRALHDASFRAVDADLAALAASDLGDDDATPDLTTLGFRFVGAGPCPAQKVPAVHLLYRSIDPLRNAAVSVFVLADVGQFPKLDAGRAYEVSSSASPFPTIAWRGKGVVYVLLAEDQPTEMAVLQLLRPTPPDQLVRIASR